MAMFLSFGRCRGAIYLAKGAFMSVRGVVAETATASVVMTATIFAHIAARQSASAAALSALICRFVMRP